MSHTREQRLDSTRHRRTWAWNAEELDVHWVENFAHFQTGEPLDGAYLRPRREHHREACEERTREWRARG